MTSEKNDPQGDIPEEAHSPGASSGDSPLVDRERAAGELEDPQEIGPYRILGVLGEGGMGMVYLAEQSGSVRRRVALKLVKLGMDTKQVVARFESERQALAVMDHPNIARVYDGGATETGRPYFAMELVQGVPITDYCDRHKLSTEERIRLFLDVCRAVQHAHQKGVIHRDLKPSNVMVTVKEGRPAVKVIDFGIAKAIGQGLTARTLVTRVGQLVGTPEYMSPEQAEMSGLDVDTRTDIYALGVILYELLVGALPFDFGTKADYAIQHAIRETEVPRPSMKLTSLSGTRETIARYRRTSLQALRKELRGDLDWIILKSMEKDRTRRYETANGLTMELERYLNNEPVLARPPSVAYRFQKLVRRNRGGVAAAAVALLALALGTAGATVGLIRARRAEQVAREEAETARQVSGFLEGLFEVSNPNEARGNTITAREILDRGAEHIQTELRGQPAVQARLIGTIGNVYRTLGLYNEAVPLLEQALAIREATLSPDHPELAQSLHRLAIVYKQQGRFERAERLFGRALNIREESAEEHPLDLAYTLGSLGGTLLEQGKYEEAEPLLLRAFAIREEILDPDHPDVALSLANLGAFYWMQRRVEDAEPYMRRSLEIRERVLGSDHPDIADGLNNLGVLYWTLGQYEEARVYYERARAIYERALGPDHDNTATAYNNLAETYWVLGEYAAAEPLFLRALEIKERILQPDHPKVSTTLRGLANLYRDQKRYAEAEPLYLRTLDILETSMGPDDPSLTEALQDYATLLSATGRANEARRLNERADAINERRQRGT
jgi:non-specific serine/threonine protein kinase/serine/threonine-protein kinase